MPTPGLSEPEIRREQSELDTAIREKVEWISRRRLLNVRETAAMLGVSESTVRNWSDNGVLHPVLRLPRSGYRRFDPEEVEQLLARSRGERLAESGRWAARESAGFGELTERERKVVALTAAGMTNDEIAAELFISVRTVGTHLAQAYRKLGMESRNRLPAEAGREAE